MPAWTDGVSDANAPRFRNVRVYAEGAEYRLGGTALERPETDNPHVSGTPESDSWAAGWADARDGTIEKHVASYDRVAPL